MSEDHDSLTALGTPRTSTMPDVSSTLHPSSAASTTEGARSTTQSISMEPLQVIPKEPTFTNFSKLAMELRLMIWQHALPEPRLIIVKTVGEDQNGGPVGGFTPGSSGHFASGLKTVALTQVNKEARTEALKQYRLSFRDKFNGNAIHFDFARDTLLLSDAYTFSYFFSEIEDGHSFLDEERYCFENLQHLVVADWMYRLVFGVIYQFCRLEDFTALHGDRMYRAQRFLTGISDMPQMLRDSWPGKAIKRGQSDFVLPRMEESTLGVEEFTKSFQAKHAAH